jgi:hypothetical protein
MTDMSRAGHEAGLQTWLPFAGRPDREQRDFYLL